MDRARQVVGHDQAGLDVGHLEVWVAYVELGGRLDRRRDGGEASARGALAPAPPGVNGAHADPALDRDPAGAAAAGPRLGEQVVTEAARAGRDPRLGLRPEVARGQEVELALLGQDLGHAVEEPPASRRDDGLLGALQVGRGGHVEGQERAPHEHVLDVAPGLEEGRAFARRRGHFDQRPDLRPRDALLAQGLGHARALAQARSHRRVADRIEHAPLQGQLQDLDLGLAQHGEPPRRARGDACSGESERAARIRERGGTGASTRKLRCSPRRDRRSWQGARIRSNAGHFAIRATPPGATRPSEMHWSL